MNLSATQEKSLLRHASKDLLQQSVVAARMQSPDSPLRELVDVEEIKSLAEHPEVAGQNYVDRRLNIDTWLTEYGVDLQV